VVVFRWCRCPDLTPAWAKSAGIFLALAALLASTQATPVPAWAGETAGTIQRKVGDQTYLGRSADGEECFLRLSARSGARGGGDRFDIYCEGVDEPVGDVRVSDGRGTGLPKGPTGGEIAQLGSPELTCTSAVVITFVGDSVAKFQQCRTRSEGLPYVSVATRHDGLQYVLRGMPVIYPVLQEALVIISTRSSPARKSERAGKVSEAIRKLEDRLGKPLAMLALREVKETKKLRSLGHEYNSARRYAEAESVWRKAVKIFERSMGSRDAGLAYPLIHLALNVSNQGRYEEAAAKFQEALPLVQESGDQDLVATYLVFQAIHLEHSGFLREAHESLQKAMRIRQRGETARGVMAHTHYHLARVLLGLGDAAAAIRNANAALNGFVRAYGSTHLWVGEARHLLAQAYKKSGALRKARRQAETALRLRRLLFGPSVPLAESFVLLGEIESAAGDRQAAARAYQGFMGVFRDADRLFAEADPALFEPAILALLRRASDTTDRTERSALISDAFLASQSAHNGAASQAIRQLTTRLTAGSKNLLTLTRKLQDSERRIFAMRVRLAATIRDGPARPERPETADLIDRLGTELKNKARLAASIRTKHPRYTNLAAPGLLAPGSISSLLRSDEAILSFFVSPGLTAAFLVRSDRILVHATNLTLSDLNAAVLRLREGVMIRGGNITDFNVNLSYRLYDTLVGDLDSELDDVKHLIFVPSGPLLSIPPAIFVTKRPKGKRRGYKDVAWLVRKVAISVLPSIQAFRALRTQVAKSRASKPFLGFGAPFLGGPAGNASARRTLETPCRERNDLDTANLVRTLPPLPETADELRQIARTLGADAENVRLGRDASEASIDSERLEDFRVLAFATHGILPGAFGCDSEPALALTPSDGLGPKGDGLLTATEIGQLRLDADLVLLSACDTAGPDRSLRGESLSGLTRAFLYAGARRVMASHWAVISEPTVDLTTGMFEAYGRGRRIGYAEALRRAQLRLIRNPRTTHPIVWGAFVLVGDGRLPGKPKKPFSKKNKSVSAAVSVDAGQDLGSFRHRYVKCVSDTFQRFRSSASTGREINFQNRTFSACEGAEATYRKKLAREFIPHIDVLMTSIKDRLMQEMKKYVRKHK
jgi:CHAT domain-containing protein/tetratricopeptide (TPR) repeat protein